jgi:hypothetical protein
MRPLGEALVTPGTFTLTSESSAPAGAEGEPTNPAQTTAASVARIMTGKRRRTGLTDSDPLVIWGLPY